MRKKTILYVVIIFTCFYTLYLAIAFLFAETAAFDEYDLICQIDVPRVVNDMTEFSANHYRTAVHPVYVILVNPISSLLKYLVNSKIAAAILINSFFGALGAAMAFLFFWLYSRNYFNSLVLSSIFGLSISQFLLSIVPDTSSLAICSLIFTYTVLLITLETRRPYFILWVLAGIFSLGVTSTNFVQTLICFSVATAVISDHRKIMPCLRRIFYFAIVVFISTAAISVIQKMIYPSSTLFFRPWVYANELRHASLLLINRPLEVIGSVIKQFFLVNIIAPLPTVFSRPDKVNLAVTLWNSWDYTYIGWLGAILWICLLTGAFLKNMFFKSRHKPFFFAVLLCIVFNLALHCFYGVRLSGRMDLFIYTGNVTFLVLSFLGSYALSERFTFKVALVTLAILIGVNNIFVINHILSHYPLR